MVWLLNDQDWHKIEFESRTRFGFRMGTVVDLYFAIHQTLLNFNNSTKLEELLEF
jgi:hypothetical protein